MMIGRILYGYKATQCLYVAAKLDIADHLATGAKNSDELATLTNTDSQALYRVMRCLASLNIFEENSDKKFSLNENAKAIATGKDTLKDFVILCGEELYRSAGDLLYTVKTGSPAFDHIYGMSHWEYLNQHPDKAAIFNDAMQKGSGKVISETLKNYDFTSYKNIIDLGGGKGHLLCAILSQYPNSQGIVFDLPHAKKAALDFINEEELQNRCQFMQGDFLNQTPPSGDLYLLKVVLHDWDDESAITILKNCRSSISSNGKVILIEKIIEDNGYKDMVCLGDINMLVTLTGKERSLTDFQKLLGTAGFKVTQKIDTSTSFSIIEAQVNS